MRRRTIHKIARLGDVEAIGKTLAEADANLHDAVEKAVTGSYTPDIITAFDLYCLVYRTPQSWWYCAPRKFGESISSGCSPCDSFDDATKRARQHLAQCAFRLDRDEHEIAKIIHNETDRSDFLRWCRWQRSYARLKAEGHDDNYCFNNARE